MAPCEFVTHADFALLCNINTNELVHTWWQFVAILTGEHFDIDDFSAFAVRHLQAGVTNFASFFTKDGTKQTLFWCEFRFTLRCYFAHQHIARTNFSTNTNNAAVVEIAKNVVGQVRNVAADFFCTQFGIACINFMLVNVDRSKHVVFH